MGLILMIVLCVNFFMNFPCPSAGAKVTNEGYKYPGLSNNLGSDAVPF